MTPFSQIIAQAIEHHRVGNLREAEALYRQVLASNPRNFDALHMLGVIHYQRSEQDEAAKLIRAAIAVNPNDSNAYNNLGEVMRHTNAPAAAIELYQRAIALNPRFAMPYVNMGLALMDLARAEEAAAVFREAIARDPNDAETKIYLGHAYRAMRREDLAAAAWEEALPQIPVGHPVRQDPGAAYVRIGRFGAATQLLEAEVANDPTVRSALNNLGNAYNAQGRSDDAIAAYRRGVELHVDELPAYTNLLFAMNHNSSFTREQLVEEHREWARRHADHRIPPNPVYANTRDPDRKLRIGYVSPAFLEGSAAFFMEPLLSAHDHTKFFIKCYSDAEQRDDVTTRLAPLADAWQVTAAQSDEEFVEQLRADEIDILVELSAHTIHNRLLAAARRPVPVTISYLAYPNTTGLSAIDYRVTDVHIDPPGTGEEIEKLIRLPESYYCYAPPADAPGVVDPPAVTKGYVTFGSFNRLIKLSEPVIKLWSRVLKVVPNSMLMLKANGLWDEPTRQGLARRFARYGIEPARLKLTGWSALNDYLAALGEIDIALDTFPFCGGTTSCHMMWMGRPLVTLAYPSPVARMGVSLLNNLGLADLVARDADEYVAIAAKLANDTARLVELRRSMRKRMKNSPLMDAKRFARHLEAGYRIAWTRRCAGEPVANIDADAIRAATEESFT